MKTNINSIDKLNLIKENFNAVIDDKINEAKLNILFESFDNLSLGCLNELFKASSEGLYESKKGKKLIKEYVSVIKGSKGLKTNYTIFESLKNNSKEINKPDFFITEAVKLYSNSRSDTKKIAKIVSDCIKESKLSIDTIKEAIDNYNDSICASIDYILENKCNSKNITEYCNNVGRIVDYLNESRVDKKDDVEIKSVKEVMSDINESLAQDNEKYVTNLLNDIYFSGKSNEKLFESYKEKCISLLSESLEAKDIEEGIRMNALKDKLTMKEFNKDTVNEDLLKLSELIETLSN